MQIKLSEHLVLQQPKLSANELSQSLANKFTMLSSCEGWRSEVIWVGRGRVAYVQMGWQKGETFGFVELI